MNKKAICVVQLVFAVILIGFSSLGVYVFSTLLHPSGAPQLSTIGEDTVNESINYLAYTQRDQMNYISFGLIILSILGIVMTIFLVLDALYKWPDN